jgi:hypothetical protein
MNREGKGKAGSRGKNCSHHTVVDLLVTTVPSSTNTVDPLDHILSISTHVRVSSCHLSVYHQSLIKTGPFREETLQDVPESEIESNWDQVVDK